MCDLLYYRTGKEFEVCVSLKFVSLLSCITNNMKVERCMCYSVVISTVPS